MTSSSSKPEASVALRVELLNQHAIGDSLLHYATGSLLLLIFFRGHWCPFCRRYLSKIQSRLPDITGRGVAVVAISPDPVAAHARLASELQLTFPLLSDPRAEVIDAFKMRNRLTRQEAVMPHPGVVLIDVSGTVRFQTIDRNYKKRTTIRAVLQALVALEQYTKKEKGGAPVKDAPSL